MNTYNQLIHRYRKEFIDKGLPPETVKAFLFELCNDEKVNLYLDMDQPVKESIQQKFDQGIVRIMNHEPMNYVLGYAFFYGYKFIVNPDVLIPRPETEELVALILSNYDLYFSGKNVNVFDIGTGSGAIAIALKKEEEKMNLYASDISKEALEVAKDNAQLNKCPITFLEGSMLEP